LIRALLVALAVFDTALGLASVAAPQVVADLLWPAAGPGGLALIRRTGAIWLFFAAVEATAVARPGLVRLVALLRWMDVPADALWFLFADGLTTFGKLGIGLAPLANIAIGAALWRSTSR